ncbi:hypothetical protein FACS1894125_7170 [Actinomycetota bacterium]|nr:hypothetical protein FACS1894125_7170 [Actinomycetota bacterium]
MKLSDEIVIAGVRESAFKHGVSYEDMLYVVEYHVDYLQIEEDPDKFIYIGYDTAHRFLEVVIVEFTNGKYYINHAMKVRKGTLERFERNRHARY